MSARVDVIVVNWNDRERTPQAIDSVLALSEVRADPTLVEVIVSDNGSSDGSPDLIEQRYGTRVRVLRNGANLGFGAGVNRAFARTEAPFVFLLNPDAKLKDGCIARLLAFMDAHPRCAIAGPKIYESDGHVAESCGEFDTWTGAFLRSSAWGELPGLRNLANGADLRRWNYASERKVDLVIGAALLIRRSAAMSIDGGRLFDERYFMYHEEIDLAKRLADAGYESWFVPSAEAIHEGQGSSGGRGVEAYKQRSRRLYWIKHHGRWWYYSLSAALVARYVLYLGVAVALGFALREMLRR